MKNSCQQKISFNDKINLTIAGIVGVIVMPLLWFLFCAQADFYKDSVSDVGGKFGHYAQFVVLGVFYVAFCSYFGLRAIKNMRYKDKIAPIVYLFGLVLFLITCFVPYDKNCEGTLSGIVDVNNAIIIGDVHNVLARVSLGIILVCLVYFQIVLFFKNKKFAIASWVTLAIVVAVAIVLVVQHGTCSISECILLSYLSIYIFITQLIATSQHKTNN